MVRPLHGSRKFSDLLELTYVSNTGNIVPPEVWAIVDTSYEGRTPLHYLMGNRSLMAEGLRMAYAQARTDEWAVHDKGYGRTPLHLLVVNRELSIDMLVVAWETA